MRDERDGRGFSLIELMIVVALVGILGALAYPSYRESVLKSQRTDGQVKLGQVLLAQERFFSLNHTYTTDLGTGGLELTTDAGGAVPSDEGHYLITAEGCGGGLTECVNLVATPRGNLEPDGPLTLNSLHQKGGKW